MRSRVVLAVLTTWILALPITASAQEATLTGQVTDTTGAVLPGVVVRAIHEATGTTTEVVTDGRGVFRIPARIGAHQITAELTGFTTVTRTGVSLSVGQEITVNLQLSPSTLQETVTVTGEAPLVNPTGTRLTGVVDTRQVEELPVNGRNFMDLTLLARGATANHAAQTPTDIANRGDYQMNIDGQQVTTQLLFRINPTFSRDAIAEFEFVANRFDATQGRTHGAQLNVITKSGTNTVAGTFAGYFRDDRFNAPDFIQRRVLPYSNQQLSGTLGGPIVRNRAHFFGSYEYGREPQILTFDSPYPLFNIDSEEFAKTAHKFLGRVDLEVSRQMHLSVRHFRSDVPKFLLGGGALLHPSATSTSELHSNSTIGALTQILGNRAVNEVKVGYSDAWDRQDETLNDPFTQSLLPTTARGDRVMCLRFLGYQIGGCSAAPTGFSNKVWSVRDQFTSTYQLGPGSHTLKTGGEFLSVWVRQGACGSCDGYIDLQGGPIPANIQELFPVWNDISTWRRDAPELARIARQFEWITGTLGPELRRPDLAFWVQDDWTMSPRLTLNLGVRYDFSFNKYANDVEVLPFLPAGRSDDLNNVAPRIGFAYSMNDRTVVRGGFGLYFAGLGNAIPTQNVQAAQTAEVLVVNDGRRDFVVNPFNGPAPTREQILALGQERSILDPISSVNPDEPYSYQTSIGVERQIADSMAISVDLLITEARNDGGFGGRTGDRGFFVENVNLSYNPATGANYPFTDVSRRPYRDWGPVGVVMFGAESSRRALEFGFQKRFSNRWQAAGQYQLSRFRDFVPQPRGLSFRLADDFEGQWTLGVGDQRHRAVFNGIVDVGYGFQVSGLYFYGSGKRLATTYGGDLRRMGSFSTNRLRPDGTIVPRNDFVGDPLHRVDLRLQRRFSVGHLRVDGIAEVFNLFNHENFGNYVTVESNRNYGRPTATTGTQSGLQNPAYQSRSAQFGFRVAF